MIVTPMLDYEFISVEHAHQLNLLVKLVAPKGKAQERRGLNLCLVVDRSGSMSGVKLDYTKQAIKLLVTHLTNEDLLSIVTFESGVETVLEPTAVQNKDAIKQAVDRIESAGQTNLSGGWLKGIELVSSKADGKRLNRLLILTDGQANQGITDADQLTALGASAHQQHNLVTTTLGFGNDFNEDLLVGIAKHATGKFYYIETPDSAPAVFREELEGLLTLVAQNIELTITMQDPVRLMRQWTGYAAKQSGNTVTFNLGDAYADEEKRLLLSLIVPNMGAIGERILATLAVNYAEISEKSVTTKRLEFPIVVNLTDPATAAAAKLRIEVVEELGLQMAAEARKKAVERADDGDIAGASQLIREAIDTLVAMPSGAQPAIQAEVEALKAESQKMREERHSSASRKQMVSSSYSISRSEYAKLVKERERRKNQPPAAP